MATIGATIGSTFFAQAHRTPEKQALVCEVSALTYLQLARLVCRWSIALAENGVERGDHIGVLLPNDVDFVVLLIAAADLGAVLVPMSSALSAAQVSKAFAATDVKHVVATGAVMRTLLTAADTTFESANGLWLSVDEAIDADDQLSANKRTALLPDLLKFVPCEATPRERGVEDDAFILSMTSGSTGDPKPIILTQRTKINRAKAAVDLYAVTDSDRILTATPLYHSLAERLVLIPLLHGGTSIVMPRFSPASWLSCVRDQAVSFTIAVSSQLKQIAEVITDRAHFGDTASLRCVVSSSALLDRTTKSELLTKLKCQFHECYGTSEIAIASNLDDRCARNKIETVGKAAPDVDIKIVGGNAQILPIGEIGEIVCRTPMLFGGYYKRADLTQLAMWGEYFKTGDIGKLDAEGFLYFLGRNKDIITSGGINVFPTDIEAVVNAHASVLESAAFAYPDRQLGEVVAVAVVEKPGVAFDLRLLRFHCCERLADFQQPRKFFLVSVLPRNAMGKLMKFELVARFANEVTGAHF